MDNLVQEVVPETDEERKERRHKEQEEGKKLIVEREKAEKLESKLINSYLEKAKEDPNALFDLRDELPEVAEKVARKFQSEDGKRFNSFDEFARSISTEKKLTHDPDIDKFEKWYATKKQEEESEHAREVYTDEFKHLTEEQKEEAEKKFAMFSGWRSLKIVEAKEMAKTIALSFWVPRKQPVATVSPSIWYSVLPEESDDWEVKDLASRMWLSHVFTNPKK